MDDAGSLDKAIVKDAKYVDDKDVGCLGIFSVQGLGIRGLGLMVWDINDEDGLPERVCEH